VPLLFNHTLNLTGINITDSLAISNLIGIDVSKQLIINQPNLLSIKMSQFAIYYNNVLIDTLEKCIRMESADVSKSVLKHSETLFLDNNNYTSKLCPYLFRINKELFLFNMTDQNRLSFMDVKPQTAVDLNPSFNTIDFFQDEISLDESTMSNLVFGNLKFFKVLGTSIISMKPNLFKGFKKLGYQRSILE
jgi:hypothetical protein